MPYIDGVVVPVSVEKRDEYIAYAKKFATIFKEYGALRVVEGWADDVPDGKTTSFPMAVKKTDDEAVLFSWIEWPSKEARTKAWEKMESDERFKPGDMPFDGKRMIYGGFEAVLDE